MKNIPFYKTIKPAVSRSRIAAAGVLLLGAAALAAVAVVRRSENADPSFAPAVCDRGPV
jgi:hypothetical protein